MQDIVRVDLSERSYDIVIGPGAISQAGARIAPLIGRRPVIIVTDETVAPLHLPALESGSGERWGSPQRSGHHPARGREDQELRPSGSTAGRDAGPWDRALDRADRLGGRRGRRSGRVRRRDSPARVGLRPDPDHAAGAGGQFGRRQDRHQHPPGQEPRGERSTSPGWCWPTLRHSPPCPTAMCWPAMPRW